ncbi:uncharacterized protein LOC128234619 [Mya arenaria]|uniref:uncharacterized protein LOC128234619 n=1 Tax=Mya arenaria TaxID=6604 RepID=UPI0022E1E72D|nr:uncharacterized protein LOC128234619 [Mya arenaria]
MLSDMCLVSPQRLSGTNDLSIVPVLSIFDIYNYLITFNNYDHASLRAYHQLEGYSMFRDGYTRGIETVPYPNTAFVAVKANVKPRTNDKDPVSKRGYYSCWIMMKNSDEGSIQSAYCSCKGGIDGYCRHVVATLFEVLDFVQDFKKTSCTSGPCMWVRRASQADQLGKSIPASQLETSIMVEPSTQTAMPLYSPLSDEYPVPDPNDFLEKVKTLQPTACGLRAMYDCSYKKNCTSSPLSVKTPMERAEQFMKEHICENLSCNCSNIFMYYYLTYSENECEQIEQLTRGQSKNNNWHRMRKGLLTASNFHKITHSTDLNRTAIAFQKNSVFAENSIPDSILFGQRFENKAVTFL